MKLNISTFSRRVVMGVSALAIAASAVFVPLSAVKAANDSVAIEGDVKVANVTNGDTAYSQSVNAKVDDVVKVQVWYHNKEDANSGKLAKNLKVGVTIPTAAGKSQTINGKISADNSNTVSKNANVNLSLDNASLEYVAGSAKWRHNIGAEQGKAECITGNNPAGAPDSCYTTETISDDVAKGGDGVRLEDTKPCFAHEATVTVLMRVKASAVSVNKYVSNHDGDNNAKNNAWSTNNTAAAGSKLDYMIKVKNMGNTVLKNVIVGDNLPDYMQYVPGSTYIYNGNHPDGIAAGSDNVYKGGINIGSYNPGAEGYVVFTVQLAPNAQFAKCGNYVLTNVGVAKPEGMQEYYNTAKTTVNIPCQPTPADITVCDLTTKQIVTIKEDQFDASKYSKDLNDCKTVTPENITVCDLTTNKIVTIKESEFDSSKYSKDLNACKTTMITVCDTTTKQIVTINENQFDANKYSKDTSVCMTTPVTPETPTTPTEVSELPQTGISGSTVTFAGIGLLTAALGYAFTSSRIRKLFIG